MSTAAAEQLTFGPIQFTVVEFAGVEVDARVLAALAALGEQGQVRLVDMVIVARLEDGSLRVSELADLAESIAATPGLLGEGLIGEEDIEDATEGLQPGNGVALAAFEMCWAVELASALLAAGGRVTHATFIPAPAVNELVAASLSGAEAEQPVPNAGKD